MQCCLQLYFHGGGRYTIYFHLAGRDRTKDLGDQNVAEGGHTGSESIGMVETCILSGEGDTKQRINYGTALGPAGKRNKRESSKKRRHADSRFEEITLQLMKYPTTPMTNIVKTRPWLENDDLCYTREDDTAFKTCIDVLQSKVTTWNIFDFQIFYRAHSTVPLWNSLDPDLSEMYYDNEQSVDVLKKLLDFQFGSDYDRIVEFLTSVFHVCERKIPKLNTILIHSAPSAGKNFFFDMILCFYWNKGQLGNPNRNNQFAYQEAVNKRILLWNEPNYESSQTDMLKMVLGGDNYTVDVKYKQKVAIYRTPVIILTNNVIPLMRDPSFNDRVRQYRWETCPMLKEFACKPRPSAWLDLLEYYQIDIFSKQ